LAPRFDAGNSKTREGVSPWVLKHGKRGAS
jgi:hypothetical protein